MKGDICGWTGRVFEKDCPDCKAKRCHGCKKPVKKSDGYVCNECYKLMDIQQLEE